VEKKQFTPTEQLKERVQAQRVAFAERIGAIEWDRLVFLDESGFNLAMTPSRGWGPKGARVMDCKPANWGENLSVIGAIRVDRVHCHQTLEGAVNGPRFVEFVEKRLCRFLQEGDVVVMDNLRAHHVPAVREAIENQGAELLFMPPYSPDLNPIELCWSFIKNVVRRCKERKPDQLKRAIRNALLRVRSKMLENWFSHCVPAQPK
jgi:transposase